MDNFPLGEVGQIGFSRIHFDPPSVEPCQNLVQVTFQAKVDTANSLCLCPN